jgi:hypothetical protein
LTVPLNVTLVVTGVVVVVAVVVGATGVVELLPPHAISTDTCTATDITVPTRAYFHIN